MEMKLSEIEPMNIPPVDNDEAAAFMRHITGKETVVFAGSERPRLMMIYSLKYAWPNHSFANGWLMSIDYETLEALSNSDEFVTMEPIMKKFCIGTITIEMGGTLSGTTISTRPVYL